MPATRPYTPRVLLAFDFDKTLATSSIEAVLEVYGVDRETWDNEYDQQLGEGWDDIMRRGQALIDLGEAIGRPLSITLLQEAAERVRLYDGVLEMPDRLRHVAEEVHPGTEVEFVILSSGYAEIINATEVARAFDRTFASTFHFDEDGRARCMKRIIGHPQKALYLEAIAKDLDVNGANAPEAAGSPVDEHERHVPFDQMVYLGDGASDLHAFGLMNGRGGLSIAIEKSDSFSDEDVQRKGQRVDNLAHPDYSEGSHLLRSLEHATRACASRIALRSLGQGQ